MDSNIEQRPWGQYEVLCEEADFKTKRITVLPGSAISYQSHARREERWTIVRGQGEVTLNDQVIQVQAGTSIHIPVGAKHRIRNTGTDSIEFIEVQIGSYLGEDDIQRFNDDYGRL